MKKVKLTWLASAALATALLAGCGGGGGNANAGIQSTDISQDLTALYNFMVGLIAGTSDSTDPIDVNALSLVTDDTAETTPVN